MVIPMREELTRAGVAEARSAAEVDAAVAQPGTTMVVVNSICGCAAGKMRPGVRLALQHGTKPDHAVAVFAGQDIEATAKARSYFGGHPPTSPAIAILRDGQLVYLMQRSAIETSTAPAIAQELTRAFDTYARLRPLKILLDPFIYFSWKHQEPDTVLRCPAFSCRTDLSEGSSRR
jgi:putative YphP/YqiW family bacilliredoxin